LLPAIPSFIRSWRTIFDIDTSLPEYQHAENAISIVWGEQVIRMQKKELKKTLSFKIRKRTLLNREK
jgi:hypothetical protein